MTTFCREFGWLLLGVLFCASQLQASPPVAPLKFELRQPDGTLIRAFSRGTRSQNWLETDDRHTIIHEGGAWYYAEQAASGQLRASSKRVGSLTPSERRALPLSLRPVPREKPRRAPADPRSQSLPAAATGGAATADPEVFFAPAEAGLNNEGIVPMSAASGSAPPTAFNQNVLVLMVAFSNRDFDFDVASFQSLIFGANGSVKEFFLENSGNNFTVVPAAETSTAGASLADTTGVANDGVVFVKLATAHPDGNGVGEDTAIAAAMTAANSSVDYAAFDANSDGSVDSSELSIVLIFAGYENSYGGNSCSATPRVWGHKSSIPTIALDGVNLAPYTAFGEQHVTTAGAPCYGSGGSRQATIGIMAHELGHLMLALPDLYDTNGGSQGIGEWGLMGGGSWNRMIYSGDTPAHLLGWSKGVSGLAVMNGLAQSASPILSPSYSGGAYYRLWLDPYQLGEHFVLENRQLGGYDSGLPGAGLLITHVGAAATNQDENNKLVDVEEADGLAELDDSVSGDSGDVFPGATSNTAFNNTSNPNSKMNTGASSGVALSSITESGSDISLDATQALTIDKGHIRNDFASYDTAWGCSEGAGTDVSWTAQEFFSDGSFLEIDGAEIEWRYSGSLPATADIYIYDAVNAGTPLGNQLAIKTGTLISTAGAHRILFDTPLAVPAGASRYLVVKMSSNTNLAYQSFDTTANDTRSYLSCSESALPGYWWSMSVYQNGDFLQRLLMGARDTDKDGTEDALDDDDDGDGLSDSAEALLGTSPLDADTDDDTVNDNLDAFPLNVAASVDADGDGQPDSWNVGCDASCQASSGLTLDNSDAAGCPDYVCTPFNRGWRAAIPTLPL